MSLLEVSDLKKHFPIKSGVVKRTTGHVYAVDGVSFAIEEGKTLGLVGESGCGKSTTGRTALYLERPTAGKVRFQGRDLSSLGAGALKDLRRQMQIVFQDPVGALNPRHTVGQLIGEPLVLHDLVPRRQRRKRVEELLELVGLPVDAVYRFPHEFSEALSKNPAVLTRSEAEIAAFLLQVRRNDAQGQNRVQLHSW